MNKQLCRRKTRKTF